MPRKLTASPLLNVEARIPPRRRTIVIVDGIDDGHQIDVSRTPRGVGIMARSPSEQGGFMSVSVEITIDDYRAMVAMFDGVTE